MTCCALCRQREEAADGRPEQEPVPEEAGAAAGQRHGGVHVRVHLPAGGVRRQAGGAGQPPVRPGRYVSHRHSSSQSS